MSDLIERVAVLEDLEKRMADDYVDAARFAEYIRTLPSAEPERRKGKWSNYKDEHCCSVCKCVVISECWDDDIRYDYCPYCGAEME